MKIWTGKAERCFASQTQTLSKPWKTKEIRGACSFTDSFVIDKTHNTIINSTEPVPCFASSVPLLLWHCRNLTIFPGHIQESHSVREVKIEFQHFHYLGKISFSQASSIPSVTLNWYCQVLSAFLMGFHKFSSPLSFWSSCTLCQYQFHGF